jgi:hypothetical protein
MLCPAVSYKLTDVLEVTTAFITGRIRATFAGVHRDLYRYFSETLKHMAPVNRSVWNRSLKTVHIHAARTQLVSTHLRM